MSNNEEPKPKRRAAKKKTASKEPAAEDVKPWDVPSPEPIVPRAMAMPFFLSKYWFMTMNIVVNMQPAPKPVEEKRNVYDGIFMAHTMLTTDIYFFLVDILIELYVSYMIYIFYI